MAAYVRTQAQGPAQKFSELIDKFDWIEAELLFERMGWEWDEGRPTAAKLKEEAGRLVRKCLERGLGGMTSGRIAVAIAPNGTCSIHVGVGGYAYTPRDRLGSKDGGVIERWLLGDPIL